MLRDPSTHYSGPPLPLCTQVLRETVRKALEKPATQLFGSPERGISAYFTSPTPAIFTTGVLLVRPFGQSQKARL